MSWDWLGIEVAVVVTDGHVLLVPTTASTSPHRNSPGRDQCQPQTTLHPPPVRQKQKRKIVTFWLIGLETTPGSRQTISGPTSTYPTQKAMPITLPVHCVVVVLLVLGGAVTSAVCQQGNISGERLAHSTKTNLPLRSAFVV